MDATIFIADGVEECEATIVIDILRRSGVKIQTVAVHNPGGKYALDDPEVLSSHGVRMICDLPLTDYQPGHERCLIIPGGGLGTQNLKKNEQVSQILKDYAENQSGKDGNFMAAICAGPSVFSRLGLLDGYKATIFPGMEDSLGQAIFTDEPVVLDRDRITGRAMGAAIPFALEIASRLSDRKTAQKVCQEKIVYPYWE